MYFILKNQEFNSKAISEVWRNYNESVSFKYNRPIYKIKQLSNFNVLEYSN